MTVNTGMANARVPPLAPSRSGSPGPVSPTLAGAFHVDGDDRSSIVEGFVGQLASLEAPTICSPAANVAPGRQHAPGLRTCTQEEGGDRDRRTASTPAMAAAAAKNIAKKSASIRPRQAEAEQGDQRNYGELPYFGVQSLPSHLLLPHTGECARSGWHPWPELDCIRKMASILLDAVCAVNRENTS